MSLSLVNYSSSSSEEENAVAHTKSECNTKAGKPNQ